MEEEDFDEKEEFDDEGESGGEIVARGGESREDKSGIFIRPDPCGLMREEPLFKTLSTPFFPCRTF